jgi:ABC-2 type transport system ATP-binding protein
MILDEPFSGGLDPSAILALKRVLKHLAERDDVTIMMATPVPEIVEELAHRIALIHHGELIAVDTVEGLRQHAGVEGNLQEVLERVLNPQTLEHIDRYFQGDNQ